MKNRNLYITVIVLSAFLINSVPVLAAKLDLSANKNSVIVGEDLVVQVSIEKEGKENIKTAQIDIAYDPSILKPVQINKGIYLPFFLKESISPEGKGLVSFYTMKEIGTETKDKGILGAVVFTAIQPGKAALILGKNTEVTVIGKLGNVAKTNAGALVEVRPMEELTPAPVSQVQVSLWARFWQWLQSWWK